MALQTANVPPFFVTSTPPPLSDSTRTGKYVTPQQTNRSLHVQSSSYPPPQKTEKVYPSVEENLLTVFLLPGDDESCPLVQCSVPQPLNVMPCNSNNPGIYTLAHLMAWYPRMSCNSDSPWIYNLTHLMVGYPSMSCNSDSVRTIQVNIPR